MKLKLIALVALLAPSVQAATVFCAGSAASGSGDGSIWANRMAWADALAAAAAVTNCVFDGNMVDINKRGESGGHGAAVARGCERARQPECRRRGLPQRRLRRQRVHQLRLRRQLRAHGQQPVPVEKRRAIVVDLAALDVHLLSSEQYWLNDGTVGPKTKAVSPAIDAGDRSVVCVEPSPNGRRVNLDAYGNTPWASLTPTHGFILFVR